MRSDWLAAQHPLSSGRPNYSQEELMGRDRFETWRRRGATLWTATAGRNDQALDLPGRRNPVRSVGLLQRRGLSSTITVQLLHRSVAIDRPAADPVRLGSARQRRPSTLQIADRRCRARDAGCICRSRNGAPLGDAGIWPPERRFLRLLERHDIAAFSHARPTRRSRNADRGHNGGASAVLPVLRPAGCAPDGCADGSGIAGLRLPPVDGVGI